MKYRTMVAIRQHNCRTATGPLSIARATGSETRRNLFPRLTLILKQNCLSSVLRAMLFAMLLAAAPQVNAAPGDLVTNVNLPVSGNGVSVGVDCDGNVYYTLAATTSLYKMNKNG